MFWRNLLYPSAMNMETVGSSGTLVNTSNITRHIITEVHHLNLYHHENLVSHKLVVVQLVRKISCPLWNP